MGYILNNKIVDPVIYKFLLRLQDEGLSNLVSIGGSFALNLHGVIDRKVGDLDLIINKYHTEDFIKKLENSNDFTIEKTAHSMTNFQSKSNLVEHHCIKYKNLKVCLLSVSNKLLYQQYYGDLLPSDLEKFGIKQLNIDLVENIIAVKEEYIVGLKKAGLKYALAKHQNDVACYKLYQRDKQLLTALNNMKTIPYLIQMTDQSVEVYMTPIIGTQSHTKLQPDDLKCNYRLYAWKYGNTRIYPASGIFIVAMHNTSDLAYYTSTYSEDNVNANAIRNSLTNNFKVSKEYLDSPFDLYELKNFLITLME